MDLFLLVLLKWKSSREGQRREHKCPELRLFPLAPRLTQFAEDLFLLLVAHLPRSDEFRWLSLTEKFPNDLVYWDRPPSCCSEVPCYTVKLCVCLVVHLDRCH